MRHLITFILIVLIVQGCATGYKKVGFKGGYSEIQLDENVFKVSFRGNAYTGREKASDFALLRCAELALEKGFEYFAIIEATNSTSTSTYKTPTTTRTTGSIYGSDNYAHGEATTTTTGGQTYRLAKPSSTNTIVCFEEKPETGFAYNARMTVESISEKYGIEKPSP